MNFIWHTALSVLDLSSSLIYQLLGRDLTESDLQLLRSIFAHVATKSRVDVASGERLREILDGDKSQLAELTQHLVQEINGNIGKDLLLVTTRHNGYNLLQTCLVAYMDWSILLLDKYIQVLGDEKTPYGPLWDLFDSVCSLKSDLVRVLLEIYSCDANRGLVLSNKAKYVVDVASLISALPRKSSLVKKTNSLLGKPNRVFGSVNFLKKVISCSLDRLVGSNLELFKDYSFCKSNRSFKSNQVLCGDSDEFEDENEDDDGECGDQVVGNVYLKSSNLNRSKSFTNGNHHYSSSECLKEYTPPPPAGTTTLNTDLTTIISPSRLNEAALSELSATPIDTPLLLLTCVYNCHNLLHLVSSSRSTGEQAKKNVNKKTKTSSKSKTRDQRRHTIHGLKMAEKTNGTVNEPTKLRKNSKTDSSKSDFYSSMHSSSKPNCPNLKSLSSLRITSSSHTHCSSASATNTSLSTSSSTECDSAYDHQYSLFRHEGVVTGGHENGSRHSDFCEEDELCDADNERRYHDDHADHEEDEELHHSDVYSDDDEHHSDTETSSESASSEQESESLSVKHNEIQDDEEDESDDSLDGEKDLSNIYDYAGVEDNDKLYFEKYDYDPNSKCCMLNSTSDEFNHYQTQPLSYICNVNATHASTTSRPQAQPVQHAVEAESCKKPFVTNTNQASQTKKTLPSIASTCTINTKQIRSSVANNSYRQLVAYEKLNKQRLDLLDLLLKHGADKYLVAKLSLSQLNKMGKKSKSMLKKWYRMSSRDYGKLNHHHPLHYHHSNESSSGNGHLNINSSHSSSDDLSATGLGASVDTSKNVELRPLSPIMAALCLDDVDVFARLYKYHHVLFNYFKPDEDYELIYYAIKFQSKNCLVYLLTHTTTSNTHHKLTSSISLPLNLHQVEEHLDCQQLSKNVETMFYILENTRSSRIINVLLECGFDLTKRHPVSGNTALHCLFNASQAMNVKPASNKHVLGEYHTPKSLSKILFIMLKKGGLKAQVNALNSDKKLCMETLFEWDELIELAFYVDHNKSLSETNETLVSEWRNEFETCVHLLLKSGADLVFEHGLQSNDSSPLLIHNCIDTLFASLVKHSIKSSGVSSNGCESPRARSPTPSSREEINKEMNIDVMREENEDRCEIQNGMMRGSEHGGQEDEDAATVGPARLIGGAHHQQHSPAVSPVSNPNTDWKRKEQQRLYKQRHVWSKTLDVEFLYHFLHDRCDLNSVLVNLSRLHSHHHHHHHHNIYRVDSSDSDSHRSGKINCCVVEKFLTLLLNVHIDNFECSLRLFRLLCHFQKEANKVYRLGVSRPIKINSHLVKKLISTWLLQPNFLNSSKQFEKNYFIKSIVVELVMCDLYDLNPMGEEASLLNHCVELIFTVGTVYQMELIYDMMRTLIQYGAHPNLDSNGHFSSAFDSLSSVVAELSSNSGYTSNSGTSLASSNHSGSVLYVPSGRASPQLIHQHSHHHHHHHHRHHHHHHHHKTKVVIGQNKFDNRALRYSSTSATLTYLESATESEHQTITEQDLTLIVPLNSNDHLEQQVQSHSLVSSNSNNKLVVSNPILLLTPTPSYASLLTIATNANAALTTTNNVISVVGLSHPHHSHHHHHHHNHKIQQFSDLSASNVFVDSSIIFLEHYKRFTKLLCDSIDSSRAKNLLRQRASSPVIDSCLCNSIRSNHQHHNQNQKLINSSSSNSASPTPSSCSSSSEYGSNTSLLLHQQVSLVSSLDMHLERLAITPRSLKSLCRRLVLTRLVDLEKKKKKTTQCNNQPSANSPADLDTQHNIVLVSNQIAQLTLPKRVKNYLLYLE